MAADVRGAAEETGKQALILNEAQTQANRPNQSNAWGSTTWGRGEAYTDPLTGETFMPWTQTETLNPQLQASLDSQMGVERGRNEMAEGMMGRVWDDFSNPMDFDQHGGINQLQDRSQFNFDMGGERQRAEDAAYGRATSRLDPRFQGQEQSLLTRLKNQGLSPGDQAYDSAMANFGRERTDAYDMAQLGAVGEGRSEVGQSFQHGLQQNQQNFGQGAAQNQMANALRTQGINEDITKRNFNFNEMQNMMGAPITGGPPTSGGQTQVGSNQPNPGTASRMGA